MIEHDEYRVRCVAMAEANDRFLKALDRERKGYRQQMPDNVVWRREHPINEGVAIRYSNTRKARFTERDEMAENLRVDRDPCFQCGARKDIGCEHRKVAA